MSNVIRHGDVNFIRVEKVPKEAKKVKSKKRFVVAEGEATNSEHTVNVKHTSGLEVYSHGDDRYLVLLQVGNITHTHDHETIKIDKGIWKQVPEREVDHFADSIVRKVID